MNPDSMSGDVTAGMVSSDWYPSGTYTYDNSSYMTPFPTTTVPSQQWTQYAPASLPEMGMPLFETPQSHQPQPSSQQHTPASLAGPIQMQAAPQFNPQPAQLDKEDARRRASSTGTYMSNQDQLSWTTSGLGIHYPNASTTATPAASTYSPNVFPAYTVDEQHYNLSSPELHQPIPRRSYTSIAPNPAGMTSTSGGKKRRRDDDEQSDVATMPMSSSTPSKRPRKSSVPTSADLSEDDKYLVRLKEEEHLPWKDIAARYLVDKNKVWNVAALQMRYKRMRVKFRVWEDQDLDALRKAHEFWEQSKWEIIANKMLEYGVSERWPSKHCAKKWQELEPANSSLSMPQLPTTSAGVISSNMTPASFSQFSSPIEAPVPQFTFMPLS